MQQPSLGAVGVRRRERDAQQREQLVQAVTVYRHSHVNCGQLERSRDRAFALHAGAAYAGVDLQRIGLAVIAQCQHRTTAALGPQHQALVLALGLEAQALEGRACDVHASRGELCADVRGLCCVVVAQRALLDGDATDRDARALVLLLRVQQPALAAGAALLQKDAGRLQAYLREREPALQQLGQIDGHVDGLRPDHLRLLGPAGIGEAHTARLQAQQRPGQMQPEVAADHQRPPGLLQRDTLDRTAQPVPAKQRDGQGRERRWQQQRCARPANGAGPGEGGRRRHAFGIRHAATLCYLV